MRLGVDVVLEAPLEPNRRCFLLECEDRSQRTRDGGVSLTVILDGYETEPPRGTSVTSHRDGRMIIDGMILQENRAWKSHVTSIRSKHIDDEECRY